MNISSLLRGGGVTIYHVSVVLYLIVMYSPELLPRWESVHSPPPVCSCLIENTTDIIKLFDIYTSHSTSQSRVLSLNYHFKWFPRRIKYVIWVKKKRKILIKYKISSQGTEAGLTNDKDWKSFIHHIFNGKIFVKYWRVSTDEIRLNFISSARQYWMAVNSNQLYLEDPDSWATSS